MGGVTEMALFLACMAPQIAVFLWARRERITIR